jgi:AcrR family transcriptional regulator
MTLRPARATREHDLPVRDSDVVAGSPQPLRSDAQRNRESILIAAAATFDELGLNAPAEQIARRAGVGSATLYRHFPTRRELVETAFGDDVNEMRQAFEDAVNIKDAWQAFAGLLEQLFALQARNRGLSDLMTIRFPSTPTLAGAGGRSRELVGRVVTRAQQAGELRADFAETDLPALLWANARIIEATRYEASGAWRRFLAFTLDGLRAENAHPTDQPPLSTDQARAAMLVLGREAGVAD